MNVHSANQQPRGRPLVDDKRRRILDAALRTFAERGFHGTAVPEVAAAAGVGTGTLYRYFANKEALVNEVFRDAKTRLGAALSEAGGRDAHAWFRSVWQILCAFALAESDAFAFLEMQDHRPYLDDDSQKLELAVLAPLWLVGREYTRSDTPTDLLMALIWGAFVGLLKASRGGYLALDGKRLRQAGDACWHMIAPFLKINKSALCTLSAKGKK